MTFWLIVAIMAVVLSPLAWLVPSRRQQGQVGMRLAARQMGLNMQLAPQDWPHWLEPEPPSPCAQYHRARYAGHHDSWCYWQMTPGQWLNQWREPCTDSRVAAHLATLPADVFKVEAGPQMLALCWGERGESQALQRVAALFKALA